MMANAESLPARTSAVLQYAAGSVAAIALLALTGCAPVGFNEGRAMQVAYGQLLDFQSEQVSLSNATLGCAVDNGLFLAPATFGSRTLARLTDAGRALGFSDDVSVDEPGYNSPYTQVRGKFPVEFTQVVKITDVQKGVKRVEARAGLRIAHECFGETLQLMGIRNGVIAQKNPAAFEFDEYGEEDWRLISVLH